MDVKDCIEYLIHDLLGSLLRVKGTFLFVFDIIQQLVAFDDFHDDVDVPVILEGLLVLGNVGMVQLVDDSQLLVHLLLGELVHGFDVYYLNSILPLILMVLSRGHVDVPEGTLAEQLLVHGVEALDFFGGCFGAVEVADGTNLSLLRAAFVITLLVGVLHEEGGRVEDTVGFDLGIGLFSLSTKTVSHVI